MEDSAKRARPLLAIRGLVIAFILTGLAVGIVWRLNASWQLKPSVREIKTEYRNARAGVKYVGDASCTTCHAAITETYRNHPMGHSIIPISAAESKVQGDFELRKLFESQGFEYALKRVDGRTQHYEIRRDSRGKVVGQVEGEVEYVLGSGSHALSFLIERDGYLFQSPITWYSQKKRWDLSPSYENRGERFERQITPGCLVCHANEVTHVEGTEGRYEPPTFRGHSIGCERCHGPGELHVREAGNSPEKGPNIVNPARLEPVLREAVCQQCHLLGDMTIARYGRKLRDYRPGLPLSEFVTVFVKKDKPTSEHPNGDHVEQMYQSRCFKSSDGKLGCISCHDPHQLPAPTARISYYRNRCLECHASRGCLLPENTRRMTSLEDSCIDCHMPKAPTSDIPHLATTIHIIPRTYEPQNSNGSQAHSDALPVPFHQEYLTDADNLSVGRDLGVALRHQGAKHASVTLPFLEAALKAHPDDRLARESLGFTEWALGRDREAMATFESVLREEPTRESSLEAVGLLAGQLSERDRAIDFWRRAIAVDPWRSSFHAELAHHLTRRKEWSAAAESGRAALRINPSSQKARAALILALLRMGTVDEAQENFAALLEYAKPGERDGLLNWFQSLR